MQNEYIVQLSAAAGADTAYFVGCGLMSRSMPGILPPAWTEGIWPSHFAIQRSVTASCCHLMMFSLMDAARKRLDSASPLAMAICAFAWPSAAATGLGASACDRARLFFFWNAILCACT